MPGVRVARAPPTPRSPRQGDLLLARTASPTGLIPTIREASKPPPKRGGLKKKKASPAAPAYFQKLMHHHHDHDSNSARLGAFTSEDCALRRNNSDKYRVRPLPGLGGVRCIRRGCRNPVRKVHGRHPLAGRRSSASRGLMPASQGEQRGLCQPHSGAYEARSA